MSQSTVRSHSFDPLSILFNIIVTVVTVIIFALLGLAAVATYQTAVLSEATSVAARKGIAVSGVVPAVVTRDGDALRVDVAVRDASPFSPSARGAASRPALPRLDLLARVRPTDLLVSADAAGIDWVEVVPRGAAAPLAGDWPAPGIDPAVTIDAERVTLHVRSADEVVLPR